MARKIRLFISDTSQHVLLKSLDSLILFRDRYDYESFKKIALELSKKNSIYIHAYVLKQNYFEFVATPQSENSLPKFMQSLGRLYVAYYNKKYNRTGSLWDGRYKSSIVEDKVYLFEVMKFIEKQITNDRECYSSNSKNLYDKKDDLVIYHQLYKDLGFTQIDRIARYSHVFNTKTKHSTHTFIKDSLYKQTITGSDEFIKELERKTGLNLFVKRRGRPKKEDIKKGKKMYKNLVVLDKEKHKEFKINPLENLEFARHSSFVPLNASEVALVGATFPVVFSADENPSIISIISLGGENLGLNSDGKWITSYVPSFFRKYPFSLASTKENPNQKVILIDEDSNLFSKSKGKKLFKTSGEQSETLEHAIKFLTSLDQQMLVTKNIAKIIAQSGILEDREISIGEGEEKKVLVNGFKVVDREKLNALSDDILADWVRKGIMTMIDAHLKSLENIQTLFNITQKRQN